MQPEWIIAVATIVYAFFTGWIIFEMRRDRKLSNRPVLEAILKDASYPYWLLFRVKNVGKGPALTCRPKCADNKGTEWLFQGDILPIGSCEFLDLRFTLGEEDYKLSGEKILLEIEYSDVFGRTYRKTIAELDTNWVIKSFQVGR